MWSSRLYWKLFAGYAALLFAFITALSLVLAKWNQAAVTNAAHSRLSGIAMVIRSQLEADLAARDFEALRAKTDTFAAESGVRVTLIDSDGVVVADSVEIPAAMQNHSNRPDLIDAREHGTGENIRRSPTLGRRMQYYSLAVHGDDELLGFVRVSVDEPSAGAAGWSNQRALWGLGLVTLVAVAIVSHYRTKNIVANLQRLSDGARAVAAGDLKASIASRTGNEFEDLAASLAEARTTIAHRIAVLKDHNETMSTVLGGMIEGVLAVDSDRRVLLANEACLSLLNVTGPVVSRPLMEVIRHVEIEAVVAESLQSNSTCQREIDLPGPPRRTLNVLATQWASATKLGVVVVMHDVTALRQLENMRRDFVANVSHELKTPLASIKAYSETLRMGAINDAEHNLGFVERISEEAERLHQLIADILHLARVESGDEAFEMTAVDVGSAAARCVDQHRTLAAQKEVSLSIEPPHRAATIWADSDSVCTILTNLIGNAVKFTPSGGKVIVRWFAEHEQCVIEVQDTGIGIATEDQQRVFERFFRVDKARSREFGGTGLGLAIVKHLAQRFGGSVAIESQIGQGAMFRVWLPKQ